MKVITKPNLPISKPGIYANIPIEVYHSAQCTDGNSVSSSDLRTAWSKSLRHTHARWAHNPNRPPKNDNDETMFMRFGRAAHHLILGEDDFSLQYVVHPEKYRDKVTAEEKPWHMAANYCKKWVADMRATGRTVLKPAEIARIAPIVASLRLEPLVQADGLTGLVEHSMVVKDKETGLFLRCRPDVIPNDGDYVDLKMTGDVTDDGVRKSLRSFLYHMQGGLIWEVCEQLGLPFTSFTLLLVERDEPHCTRAVPLDMEDLALGRLQCRAMIRRVAECIERDYWPGPGEGELRSVSLAMTEREWTIKRLEKLGL